MKYVAGKFPTSNIAKVFHVPMCRFLRNVKWLDTDTHEYCEYAHISADMTQTRVVQARKITVNAEATLFLIDPIEDEDSTSDAEEKAFSLAS